MEKCIQNSNFLYSKHTESTLRKHVNYLQQSEVKDGLDFNLKSVYQHSSKHFAKLFEYYLQPETIKMKKNGTKQKKKKSYRVKIGGIQEKGHRSYVKLINSCHHSSLSNPGYSRQIEDGRMFSY